MLSIDNEPTGCWMFSLMCQEPKPVSFIYLKMRLTAKTNSLDQVSYPAVLDNVLPMDPWTS